MAIHVRLFITMGRTSRAPPGSPSSCPLLLPTIRSALVTESPPGGRFPFSFFFFVLPTEGTSHVTDASVCAHGCNTDASQAWSLWWEDRRQVCPSRARVTRGRGGLESAQVGYFLRLVS